MNISTLSNHPSRHARQGSAVIAIMVMVVASNTRTVNWLRGEVRLVDKHETARLAASATNQVSHPLPNPATAP
jgi:hypothetical protein